MVKRFLPFAINSNGQVVSIAEVERGRKCNCTCPGCGKPLVARKGDQKEHHFAHDSGTECATGFETSLHLAVKQLLNLHQKLLLPECILCQEGEGESITYEYREIDPRWHSEEVFDVLYPARGVAVIPSRMVTFDTVTLEQTEGDIRPDIVGYVGNIPLFIEVAVTHFVDAAKQQKLRARGISTIEIDFSKHPHSKWTWAELEHRLLRDIEGKNWLINRRAEDIAAADRQAREKRAAPLLAEKALYEHKILVRIEMAFMQYYRVALSEKCVSVAMEGVNTDYFREVFRAQMKKRDGKFNGKRKHWEFPPSEDTLIKIATGLHAAGRKARYYQLIAPPDDASRIRILLGMPWPKP